MSLHFTPEVGDALMRDQQPVVALETSVVAQGLPYPQNLEAARECEEAVRSAGAIPAPIAVIDGQLCVGLEPEQMRRLAAGGPELLKLGSRDLPIAVAQKKSGGTTVSATCEIAAAAGIRVFATGGIGGVHRDAVDSFDVSQDLWALSHFPVAVVSAGAKSILDLPRTLEVLESLAVPVVGVGTKEFPAFYSRNSGLLLEHSVEGAQAAAAIARARFDLGQGGLLFALPPPEGSALPGEELEKEIQTALKVAEVKKLRGKALTPFLLSEIARRTGGKSLGANLALLEHNARFAGELAMALCRED